MFLNILDLQKSYRNITWHILCFVDCYSVLVVIFCSESIENIRDLILKKQKKNTIFHKS